MCQSFKPKGEKNQLGNSLQVSQFHKKKEKKKVNLATLQLESII